MWTETFISTFQTRNNSRVYYDSVTEGSVFEFRRYNARISARLLDIIDTNITYLCFPRFLQRNPSYKPTPPSRYFFNSPFIIIYPLICCYVTYAVEK
jgi:hypothetical protein